MIYVLLQHIHTRGYYHCIDNRSLLNPWSKVATTIRIPSSMVGQHFFLEEHNKPQQTHRIVARRMVSKAWYKPSTLPQLIARFDSLTTPRRRIEIFTTTCIVSNNFGKQCGVDSNDDSNHLPQCSVLINPANPNLTGPNSFVSIDAMICYIF